MSSEEKQENIVEETAEEHPEEQEPDDADMGDFTVVDEADMSNSENGITDDEANGTTAAAKDDSDKPRGWPAPRSYTDEDFHPTKLDPRCQEDWPLAAYWPVYVGNFRVLQENATDAQLNKNIHQYFVSKGIPSFMVFRWKDSFYEEYQKRAGLHDMLVYFCTEQDANRAIEWCNRDLYYGHRLNVYSGRTPALFAKQESWRMTHLDEEDKLARESTLEAYLRRYGDIRCITKQDMDSVLVQYGHSFHDGIETFARDKRVRCAPIMGPVSKQRFLEQDVEEEIQQQIDSDPGFMEMNVGQRWLAMFKAGVIPRVWRKWERTEEDIARLKALKPDGMKRSRNFQESHSLSAQDELQEIQSLKKRLRAVQYRQNVNDKRAYTSYGYHHQPRTPYYNPTVAAYHTRRGGRRNQWRDDRVNY